MNSVRVGDWVADHCLQVCIKVGCVPPSCWPYPVVSRGWGVSDRGVNRMTDRCKNITLPQTSFAGGNNADFTSSSIYVKHLQSTHMIGLLFFPRQFLVITIYGLAHLLEVAPSLLESFIHSHIYVNLCFQYHVYVRFRKKISRPLKASNFSMFFLSRSNFICMFHVSIFEAFLSSNVPRRLCSGKSREKKKSYDGFGSTAGEEVAVCER